MGKTKLNRLLTVGAIVLVIYVFISSGFHYHPDGKNHNDCLLCQQSGLLHSAQAESPFTLNNNYELVFKITQSNINIPFLISIQDYFIRPPPHRI